MKGMASLIFDNCATRKVLPLQLSNTLYARLDVETSAETRVKYGKPGVINTNQGSRYIGLDLIKTLTRAKIKTLMDGRGRCLTNILI